MTYITQYSPDLFANLPDDELVVRGFAAGALKLDPRTLANWKSTRRVELPVIKVGRCARYRVGDLREFIQRNRQVA